MKKILLTLFSFLVLGALISVADVMPVRVSLDNPNTLGLYQVSNEIDLYSKPEENADIVHSIRWSKDKIHPASVTAENLFVVHLTSRDFGLVAVTDENEEWVEIIYDKTTGAKGWIKKDDPYKFMSWINFINMYGKKYGLTLLNGAPESAKNLYSGCDDFSQVVGRLNHPQKINLNALRGNWALVSVYDLDKVPKTGYIRWRADNGVKYYFPAMR